jgi:hypothetical protein
MSTFVFRLTAPRPTFALDMSNEEREIMARHAEHWRPWVESGQMVIFGPVLDALRCPNSGTPIASQPRQEGRGPEKR